MKNMLKVFEDFFDQNNIDVRGEISAADCSLVYPHLMPEKIRSVIVWLLPYYTGPHPGRNISLYAVSKDYHIFAKDLGSRLVCLAKKEFPSEEFYNFCDSSPIDEVKAAVSAGLGVLGRNRLLINEKYGSYVFIASMLTTMSVDCESAKEKKGCFDCGKCARACDFLAKKTSVCHSELTQRKIVTEKELAQIKSRKIRWGCDLCQEVCPMNENVSFTPIPFFYEDMRETACAEEIEKMSKEIFSERAYSWKGKKTIIRNLS